MSVLAAHKPSYRTRVVIVDDNVDAADMLGELLTLEGYHVMVAYDGARGLSLFDTFEPELAILDLGLPLIDGFTLARYVRADARFRTTPLIALSGYDTPHYRTRARKAGFDHHVAKPPRLEQLTLLVASCAQGAP